MDSPADGNDTQFFSSNPHVSADTAINFALSNPLITVTLIGINRIKYFDEDWNSAKFQLPKKLIETLDNVEDIQQ